MIPHEVLHALVEAVQRASDSQGAVILLMKDGQSQFVASLEVDNPLMCVAAVKALRIGADGIEKHTNQKAKVKLTTATFTVPKEATEEGRN